MKKTGKKFNGFISLTCQSECVTLIPVSGFISGKTVSKLNAPYNTGLLMTLHLPNFVTYFLSGYLTYLISLIRSSVLGGTFLFIVSRSSRAGTNLYNGNGKLCIKTSSKGVITGMSFS